MISVRKKQIAMFFIMLLAVQEVALAFRLKPRRKRAADFKSASTPASASAPVLPRGHDVEATWERENFECNPSRFPGLPFTWCSPGRENPNKRGVHLCAKQQLWGEKPGTWDNKVCRVSDEWMLAGISTRKEDKPPSYWLSMQINLLNAKTKKLVEHCSKDSPKDSTWQCKRTMQYVLGAIKFIGKACGGEKSGTPGVLTPNEDLVTNARSAADDASEKIIALVFPSKKKQDLVKRVVEALKSDKHGLQTDPITRISDTLNVLQEILPDGADLKGAEKLKDFLEKEAKLATTTADEEALKLRIVDLEKNLANVPKPSDFDKADDYTIEKIEHKVVGAEGKGQGNSNPTSSLMQRRDDDTRKGVGFAVLGFLIVVSLPAIVSYVWSFLIAWIFGTIFFCSVGNWNDQGTIEERLRPVGDCVGDWIKKPFVLAYKKIKPLADDKLMPLLSPALKSYYALLPEKLPEASVPKV